MPKQPAVRALSCPSCGAPLKLKPGETISQCPYCHATIERMAPVAPPPPAAPPAVQIQTPYQPQVTPTPTARPTARSGGGCGGFGALLGLAIAAAGAFIAIPLLTTGTMPPIISDAYYAREAFVLVVPEAEELPALVGPVFNRTAQTHGVAYLEDGGAQLRWYNPLMGKETGDAFIVADATQVYVVTDKRLVALQRTDGQTQWEVALSDKMPYCDTACLTLIDGQVIVLTTDGVLQAFDTTGKPSWDVRLATTPANFWPIQSEIWVLDTVADQESLRRFDAVTGTEGPPLTPRCPHQGDGFAETLDDAQLMTVDEAGENFYFIFGFGNTCAQRWEISSGTLVWENAEENFSVSWGPFAPPAVLGPTALYFEADDAIYAMELATGEAYPLFTAPPDTDVFPLAATTDRLIVQAENRRGTAQWELLGLAPQDGALLWRHDLGEAAPVSNFPSNSVSEEGTWFAHLTPQGLALVEFYDRDDQPIVRTYTLNLADGTSTTPNEAPIPTGPFPKTSLTVDSLGWRNTHFWVAVSYAVRGLDVTTGQWVRGWP